MTADEGLDAGLVLRAGRDRHLAPAQGRQCRLGQDRSGKVVKRFTVRMTGRWNGDEGSLEEHFVYSDGSTQERVWHIRHLGDGRYSGRADDVVGEAQGQGAGNAFRWSYVLALPVNGRVWNVHMDDWMYLMDGRTLLNRTAMSKLGVHLGDVTLSFVKE